MSLNEVSRWRMPCLNAWDQDQQRQIIVRGVIGIGERPKGPCREPATVELTTDWDTHPGPAFFCLNCALERLEELEGEHGVHALP